MLNRQAKILTDKQQNVALDYLSKTQHPERNRVMFLLSFKAGLRAKEVSSLTWSMVTDTEGSLTDTIQLTNTASKGKKGGRVIYLHPKLKDALQLLLSSLDDAPDGVERVIKTQRSNRPSAQTIVNFFQKLYNDLGFEGASSHSGRRNFISQAARKISSVGGSLEDVRRLAGHSSLGTTQRYIEYDSAAAQNVVKLV
ncbi:MAG: site-specific integrase [Rickettsiales bacterium]|nr:site-specific integrase [Rickettsiales bacterium]